MAIAQSIFTLDGRLFYGFVSFWSQFHSGTIKSCHSIGKHLFLGLWKKITNIHLRPTWLFWGTKVPKNQFSLTQWQLLMVPLWSWDWKLTKTRETTHIKWILDELELNSYKLSIFGIFHKFWENRKFGKEWP